MERHQLELAFASSIGPLLQTWRRAADQVTLVYGVSNAVAWPLLVIGRHEKGIRHGTLACSLGLESASLVRLISQLKNRGLIESAKDPHDKRVALLTVTPNGKAMCRELETAMMELRANILDRVSDAELEACLRVFDQLHKNLDSKQPDLIP